MSEQNKDQKKDRAKVWQLAKRDEQIASMPLTPQQLNGLLRYLDEHLKTCDHTMTLTNGFLNAEGLDKDGVLPWLADHGGYCDCEALANLEDFAESIQERPAAPKPQVKASRTPRDLQSVVGWDFSKLPAPWRIANLYAASEPLKIQLGKKSGCLITIVESPLPPGDLSADDYWSRRWYERTDLPQKTPVRVTHSALDLPNDLRSTLVQTPSWIPVYCWIYSATQEWHVEVCTELNRYQGDLPLIGQLITQLVKSQA